MDQKFIAGLGNIYTDEALHKAGIHPLKNFGSLNHEQAEKLLASIRDVLNEGIAGTAQASIGCTAGGIFRITFRCINGTGDPCHTCGTKIERIIVGQRGTHFCPALPTLP